MTSQPDNRQPLAQNALLELHFAHERQRRCRAPVVYITGGIWPK